MRLKQWILTQSFSPNKTCLLKTWSAKESSRCNSIARKNSNSTKNTHSYFHEKLSWFSNPTNTAIVASGNYLVEGLKVAFKSQSVPPCLPPGVARGPEEAESHTCQACYFLCFWDVILELWVLRVHILVQLFPVLWALVYFIILKESHCFLS